MKRNYLIALAIFSVLLLCALFQLYAEKLTLSQAQAILTNKITVLNGYNTVLLDAKRDMRDAKQDWVSNEEDITENRIDYASADLWGLGGAVLKQVIDMQDRAEIAVSLAAAIKAVQTAKSDAETAETARNTAWNDYVRLADANNISSKERLSKGPDALSVTYPNISVSCPSCLESWSGSDLGGLADHITSCSVKGHTNQSGELVSDSLPHFTCEPCPLAHQHYTFLCRGGCGELFRQPIYIAPDPEGQGVGSYTEVYYDHGVKENGLADKCPKDVSGPLPCNHTRYSCQTPACPNDANHLIDGECGRHKVGKGDAAAIAAHARLEGAPVSCTVTLPNSDDGYGNPIRCIVRDTYVCLQHTKGVGCDFYDGVGIYPPGYVVSPPPMPTPPSDGTPNCPDCTSHCSSPCSCSTSGTCNGTMVTAACGVHTIEPGSSSEHSHRYISSCSETSNGNTCTNTSGYYACAPHSHTYPAMVSCAAGHSYREDHPNRSYLDNYHRTRECRFSGCSNSWQACVNGWTAPPCNNAYRKSKGWKCGAQ